MFNLKAMVVRKTTDNKLVLGFMMLVLTIGAISPSYALPVNIPSNTNSVDNLPSLPVVSNPKDDLFVPNQVIIGFKQGISQESIDEFYNAYSSNYGLSEKKNLSSDNDHIPITKLVQTNVPINANLLNKLQQDPVVDFVEPDYLITINTNDSYYNLLWGLENTGQDIRGSTGTPDADIDADRAWQNLGPTSTVIVGSIDTGVDYNHEDLAAHMWTNPGEIAGNGIDDDHNGYVDDIHGWNAYRNNGDPNDDNGHGSHTAGTIGAVGNNQKGIVGISQDVKIIACKFLSRSGSGSTSDAIECFNYFNTLKSKGIDVRVTNNSWGGGGFSQALYNAMNNSGILHVVAAGNSGVNIDTNPTYPASYNLPNIITVAATDFNDKYASFSNYGNTVDIAAPGVDIASTYKNNGYVWMSGTSMAAPHVTGAAALAFSADDKLSPSSVKSLIMDNANTLTDHSKFTYNYHRLNVDLMLSQVSPVSPLPSTAPDAPTGLIATAGDSEVSLSWTAPSNDGGSSIIDYNIYYKLSSDSTWTFFTSTAVTSATVTALTNGQAYDFEVSAVNTIGEGPKSSLVSATPTAPSAPDAPTGLIATAGDGEVSLSWAAPSNDGGSSIINYKIYYKLTSDSSWTSSTSATTSATVSGLTNDKAYDFEVSAVNTIGEGPKSSLVSATPTAPTLTDMTISGISHTIDMKGKGGKGKLSFTVGVDEIGSGNPVSSANVFAELYVDGNPNPSNSANVLTDSNGNAIFNISSVSSGHTYTLKITNVVKTNFNYVIGSFTEDMAIVP